MASWPNLVIGSPSCRNWPSLTITDHHWPDLQCPSRRWLLSRLFDFVQSPGGCWCSHSGPCLSAYLAVQSTHDSRVWVVWVTHFTIGKLSCDMLWPSENWLWYVVTKHQSNLEIYMYIVYIHFCIFAVFFLSVLWNIVGCQDSIPISARTGHSWIPHEIKCPSSFSEMPN